MVEKLLLVPGPARHDPIICRIKALRRFILVIITVGGCSVVPVVWASVNFIPRHGRALEAADQ